MTPELTYLAYTIVLYFVIILIQASAGIRQHGGLTLANSRDNLPPANVYLARAKRNVDNTRENLWLFAPGVLIAAIAGRKKESRAAELVIPVASGLIAGQSVVGVIVAGINNFVLN